jgi:hypothetical protein
MNEKNRTEFTALGFAIRLCFAVILVLLTFNPTEYSFFHWVRADFADSRLGPLHLLAAAILAIGWAIYLRATFRSLGPIGLTLAAVLLVAGVWLLVDLGWLVADSGKAITWISLVCVALLLGIGLSWSHVRRRLSGQADVDEVQ